MRMIIFLAVVLAAVGGCSDKPTDRSNNVAGEKSGTPASIERLVLTPSFSLSNCALYPEKGFGALMIAEGFAAAADASRLSGDAIDCMKKNSSLNPERPLWTESCDWRFFTTVPTRGMPPDDVVALIGPPIAKITIFDTVSLAPFEEWHFILTGGTRLCLVVKDGKIFEKLLSTSIPAKWR